MSNKCLGCESPVKNRQKYCSRECNPLKSANCQNCGKELTKYDQNKYCSRHCATSTNNTLHKKRTPKTRPSCKICGGDTQTQKARTCKKCHLTKPHTSTDRTSEIPEYVSYNTYSVALWLTEEWDGAYTQGLSRTIKNYLLDINDYKCSSCGYNTPHPDNSTILEIDHIDGDSTNNQFNNLRVLCPNCHALTGSFRARNKNSSRTYRRNNTTV